MPLNELQKKRLEGIIAKMSANGEDDTIIDGVVERYINKIETEQQQQAAQQPAYQMGGNWANAPTGFAKGLLDVPVGMYEMGKHALGAMASPTGAGGMDLARDIYGSTIGPMVKASRPMEMLQSTPEDIGRFAGQALMGAAVGKVGGKVSGAIGEYAAPANTLAKVKGMIIKAYGGKLKAGTPEMPSSLDYAMPYILEETQGKPFIDLHHFKTLVDSATEKFSGMMRGLEDQFRGIPADHATLNQLYNSIVSKIPSITSKSLRDSISGWANELSSGVNDFGDFLRKRAELNDKVSSYEQKKKIGRSDIKGSPKPSADVNAVNEIRNIIDTTIDQGAGGNINASAMYQLESALKDIKQVGPEVVQGNEQAKAIRKGTRFGGLGEVPGEAGQLATGGGKPYVIRSVARTVTKPFIGEANSPDALMAKAGQLLQEGGLVRQPGKGAVQSPMQWWQNPAPPIAPPGPAQAPPGGGVQGVSPGVAGSMPPAIRQPALGQVQPPQPAAQGQLGAAPPPFVRRVHTPAPPQGSAGGMPNLIQVGPGRWVAQDMLEGGTPPRQLTASSMEGPYAGSVRPTEPDMTMGGYATLNNIGSEAQQFLGIRNRPVAKPTTVTTTATPVETQPAPIGNVESTVKNFMEKFPAEGIKREPIVEKAPDWPGMGEGYHVRWPNMEKGSTVYVTPGETLENKINKFKIDFPRQ